MQYRRYKLPTAFYTMLMVGSFATQAALAQSTPVQSGTSLNIRALAATCANCHGTNGNAVQGEAMVRLAGLPKEHIVSQMMAFREGKRPATVMHQLAKGYTPEQIVAIATYFSALK